MINVESFQAKLVRDPELRETSRGPVCNMRVRQVDPGKPSVFIDIAVFEEDLAQECQAELSKDSVIEVLDAGLITASGRRRRRARAVSPSRAPSTRSSPARSSFSLPAPSRAQQPPASPKSPAPDGAGLLAWARSAAPVRAAQVVGLVRVCTFTAGRLSFLLHLARGLSPRKVASLPSPSVRGEGSGAGSLRQSTTRCGGRSTWR